jgi:hypothetical protein
LARVAEAVAGVSVDRFWEEARLLDWVLAADASLLAWTRPRFRESAREDASVRGRETAVRWGNALRWRLPEAVLRPALASFGRLPPGLAAAGMVVREAVICWLREVTAVTWAGSAGSQFMEGSEERARLVARVTDPDALHRDREEARRQLDEIVQAEAEAAARPVRDLENRKRRERERQEKGCKPHGQRNCSECARQGGDLRVRFAELALAGGYDPGVLGAQASRGKQSVSESTRLDELGRVVRVLHDDEGHSLASIGELIGRSKQRMSDLYRRPG